MYTSLSVKQWKGIRYFISDLSKPEKHSPGFLHFSVPVILESWLDGHDEAVGHVVEHVAADAEADMTSTVDG